MIRCDQPSGGRRPSRTPASATSIRTRPARCSSDSSIGGGTPAGRRSPPAPKPRCARPGAPLGRRHAATRQARHERHAARRHPRATAPSRAAGSVRSPADRESCLSSTRLGVRRPPERVRSATSRPRPERAGVGLPPVQVSCRLRRSDRAAAGARSDPSTSKQRPTSPRGGTEDPLNDGPAPRPIVHRRPPHLDRAPILLLTAMERTP
jgi:hypothetical protein